MTQENQMATKITELNALFLSLNDKGQDSALNILRALEFAQTVMFEQFDSNSKHNFCLNNFD